MNGRGFRPATGRRPQAGTALLMAMITLTLVATLTAGMVWQQWRAIQVEAAERARSQATWILSGALDWARLILREDARTDADPKNQPARDHLDETWAVQLAEAPLSQFLGADQSTALEEGEGIGAYLSGQIIDAQSRYNLTNLSDLGSEPQEDGAAAEARIVARLCEALGLAPDVANRLVRQWRRSTAGAPPPPAPKGQGDGKDTTGGDPPPTPVEDDEAGPELFAPSTAAQLAWLGLEPEIVRRLEPYVEVLPERTTVNVNTAGPEVLMAVMGIDRGMAERLVQARRGSGFKDLEEVAELLPPTANTKQQSISVISKYFEVRGRLRYEGSVLEERSIVRRDGLDHTAIRRERVRPAG